MACRGLVGDDAEMRKVQADYVQRITAEAKARLAMDAAPPVNACFGGPSNAREPVRGEEFDRTKVAVRVRKPTNSPPMHDSALSALRRV
jgi:hypothetical protein